jgi:hypothetical protein
MKCWLYIKFVQEAFGGFGVDETDVRGKENVPSPQVPFTHRILVGLAVHDGLL